MHLIAVVMGAETSQKRNDTATKLLNYGFSNYGLYSDGEENLGPLEISGGCKESIGTKKNAYEALVKRSELGKITKEEIFFSDLEAPIKINEKIGEIIYKIDGREIGKSDIIATEAVERLTLWEYILKIIKNLL